MKAATTRALLLAGLLAAANVAPAAATRVFGQLFAAETGLPLAGPCTYVVLPVDYDGHPSLGHYLRHCSDDGSFFADLLPGDYYLEVLQAPGRTSHLYGKGNCRPPSGAPLCRRTGSSLLEVRNQDLGPFNLELEQAARVSGLIAFAGAPANARAWVVLVPENGDEPLSYSWSSEYDYPGLLPGAYRLVVDGSPVWQSFAWNGVPCNRWYCDPFRGERIELARGQERTLPDIVLQPLAPHPGCAPTATSLCLNQGRYRVEATWRDFGGASGAGMAEPLTADAGYFYFFSPNNVEVMIKALNACDPLLGHHFWIYGAGLTNVQVELTVTDTVTGEQKLYTNPLYTTFQPILDSAAFATCDAEPATAPTLSPFEEEALREETFAAPRPNEPSGPYCEQDDDEVSPLCLAGRFHVTARYRVDGDYFLSGRIRPITADTGTFFFFQRDNLELVVKVLDACSTVSPGYWVFASGLTDVGVDLSVEDLATGQIKVYHQEPGPFAPIIDLGSFPCP